MRVTETNGLDVGWAIEGHPRLMILNLGVTTIPYHVVGHNLPRITTVNHDSPRLIPS